MQAFHLCAPIFEEHDLDAIPGRKHLPFSGCTLEIGNARLDFGVEHNPCGIFTNGNDACREGLLHAANDASIVDWARTARIDPTPEALQHFKEALASIEGVCVSTSGNDSNDARYVLIEGPQTVDPAEVSVRVPAHWYDEAIVVLAIEPRPTDALPRLHRRLTGAGAPSALMAARIEEDGLIVECSPRSAPLVVLAVIDTELRRWNGTRSTRLLAPLPARVWTSIAARGLQAPEIAPDRILESLLEAANVE